MILHKKKKKHTDEQYSLFDVELRVSKQVCRFTRPCGFSLDISYNLNVRVGYPKAASIKKEHDKKKEKFSQGTQFPRRPNSILI